VANLVRLRVDQIEELDEEVWTRYQPEGTAKIYSVSSHGRIYYEGQQVDYYYASDGYFYFANFQHCVHLVVLSAFKGNRPKPSDDDHLVVAEHINGNFRDNHIRNLRWTYRRKLK
jgi:hypothetical protein